MTARLDPRDLRWIDGLPVTSPARTLLDLAATRYPDLERAFADAHAQRLLEPYDLLAAIGRAGPRRGVRALRALISDNETGFTRSKAERLLVGLIRQVELPEPRFNVAFRQYELDAVWPTTGSCSRSTATTTTATGRGSRATALRTWPSWPPDTA